MEAILIRLQQLTPAELRQEILGAGLNWGPITSTTRLILEKRLAQALLESQGGGAAAKPEDDSALFSYPTSCSSVTCLAASYSPSDTHASNKDCHGHDVGVNLPDSPQTVDVSGLQNNTELTSERSAASPLVYYGVCPVWDDILSRNGESLKYYMISNLSIL